MTRTSTATPLPAPVIDADLRKLMRALKLGRMLDTLPERLALAKQQSLPYADFLSLVFADEVERRDRTSADLRSKTAKLDPAMRIETFSSVARGSANSRAAGTTAAARPISPCSTARACRRAAGPSRAAGRSPPGKASAR